MLPVWVSVAVVLSGAWMAEAQAQTEPCPPGQPSDSCCPPRPGANEADEEDGLDQDCPTGDDSAGGRSHRRGDDAVLDDNDTGSSDGSFRPGQRFGRGNGGGREAPAGSSASEPPGEGEGPAEKIGAGPESGAPGSGTTGGAPATPAPVARSSPAVRAPSAAPSPTSVSGGSASKGGVGQGAGAQVAGSIARTGADIATPLGLAMTLLLAGTSLRRATRPLSRAPRRGRPARPRDTAPQSWSYVDHSASARSIEKF